MVMRSWTCSPGHNAGTCQAEAGDQQWKADGKYRISEHTTRTREARRVVTKWEGLVPQTGAVTESGSFVGVQGATMRNTPFFHPRLFILGGSPWGGPRNAQPVALCRPWRPAWEVATGALSSGEPAPGRVKDHRRNRRIQFREPVALGRDLDSPWRTTVTSFQ